MQTLIYDAGGRIPAPPTEYEKRVALETSQGIIARRLEDLTYRQSLPLEEKIAMSLVRIKEWYEFWHGNVSVSFSGGKDSSVLLWLVRSLYPEVPAVFVHTGLEYPEVVRHVLRTPNHVLLRPAMKFSDVISKFGWPIGSKTIARGIDVVRHPTDRNQNVTRLYLEGINRFGRPVVGYKIPAQWRFLLDAPFECSDKCCEIMKKRPMELYEKVSGRKPYVGLMAAESRQRQRSYLKVGKCNAFFLKRAHSAPLAFWTEQDILACVKQHQINIPSVYGEIIQGADGYLTTSGVSRTGCVFCCFGLSQDYKDGPLNRFERLAVSHPGLHHYVMERLGLRDVLAWCRKNAPKNLAKTLKDGYENDTDLPLFDACGDAV